MIKKYSLFTFTTIVFLSILTVVNMRPAQACGLCIPTATQAIQDDTKVAQNLQKHLTDSFKDYFKKQEEWLDDFWDNNVLVALKEMADQLSATTIYEGYIVGTFFDAKNQLETQQTLQKIRARTHKDYQPSTGMCQFGSAIKSLAASEQKGDLAVLTLSRRSQDRMLGNTSAISALGANKDLESRINLFKKHIVIQQIITAT